MRNNKDNQKQRKRWHTDRWMKEKGWIEIAVAVGSQPDGSTLIDSSGISAKKDDFTKLMIFILPVFPSIDVDSICDLTLLSSSLRVYTSLEV